MNEFYKDKFDIFLGFLRQTYEYTPYKNAVLGVLANPDPAWVATLDPQTQTLVNDLKAYIVALNLAADPNYGTPGFWAALSESDKAIIAGSKSGSEYLKINA